MSFAARLDGSFGYDKSKNHTGKKIENAKQSFTKEILERLKYTCIENQDANYVIKSRDSAEAFHFVDPP
jgi:DNA adenine methylase